MKREKAVDWSRVRLVVMTLALLPICACALSLLGGTAQAKEPEVGYVMEIKTAEDGGTGHAIDVRFYGQNGKDDFYTRDFTGAMNKYFGKSVKYNQVSSGCTAFAYFTLPSTLDIKDIYFDVKKVGIYQGWTPEYMRLYRVDGEGEIKEGVADDQRTREMVNPRMVAYADYEGMNRYGYEKDHGSKTNLAEGMDGFFRAINFRKSNLAMVYKDYALELITGQNGTEMDLEVTVNATDVDGTTKQTAHILLREALDKLYDGYPALRVGGTDVVTFKMMLPKNEISSIDVRCVTGAKDDWRPASIRLIELSRPAVGFSNSKSGAAPAVALEGQQIFLYDATTTSGAGNINTWNTDAAIRLSTNNADVRFRAAKTSAPYSSTAKSYAVEIHTADTLTAGSADPMWLTVYYNDTRGTAQSKLLNVSEALNAEYGYTKTGKYMGLERDSATPYLLKNGQDAFRFALSNCAQITGYTFVRDSGNSTGDPYTGAGVVFYGGPTLGANAGDAAAWKNSNMNVTWNEQLFAWTYQLSGYAPICYDWPERGIDLTTSGQVYSCNSLTAGAPDINRLKYGDKSYVVVFTTSNPADSATKKDMTFSFQYLNSEGRTISSSTWSLRSEDQNFYHLNEWDAQMKAASPQFYAGKSYYALVRMDDVKTFTSCTVTLSGQGDPYQFSSMQVYHVGSVGRNLLAMGDMKNVDALAFARFTPPADAMSHRGQYLENRLFNSKGAVRDWWSRDFDKSQLIVNYTQPILLQDKALTQVLKLASEEVLEEVEKEPELGDILDDLKFADVESGLSLSAIKNTYIVNVYVADVVDAGSTNEFFFQLIFAGGSSGVVLANEQLSGDAFRQNQTSTFRIHTNQNYGDLEKVRIICNVPDGSTAFDKANFSKIEVTRQSTASVTKNWIIESPGWIDVLYVDQESGASFQSSDATAMSDYSGQSGNPLTRSNVCEFKVTKTTGAMNMLFTVSTANGDWYGTKDQVLMTISYIDSSGSYVDTEPIDVRELVREFNENDSQAFAKGSVDNFYYSFADIKQLVRVLVSVSGGDDWNFAGMSVSRVSGASNVYRADNGQYVRNFAKMESITRCSGGTIKQGKPMSFEFEPNLGMDIPMDEQTGEYNPNFEIPPPPDVEEHFNIFVLPMDGSLNVPLNLTMRYSTLYGGMPAQLSQAITPDSRLSNGGLKALDLRDVNVGNLSGVAISSASTSSPGVSSIYIQRLARSETNGKFEDLKATYFVPLNMYLTNPIYNTASEWITSDGMAQTVTFTMPSRLSGQAAEAGTLRISQQEDVYVSIRYTSTMDDEVICQSPYLPLSSAGYNFLNAGASATLTFQQPFVNKIVGISIKRNAGETFTVENVYAENYSLADNGKKFLRSTASITSPVTVSTVPTLAATTGIQVNEDRVSPVTFEFRTADNVYAPTLNTIGMTVHYIDRNGGESSTQIENLWQYATKAVNAAGLPCDYFTQNSTTTVETMLSNVGTITGLTLHVSDMDKWMLASVSVRRTLPDGTFEEGREEVNRWVEGTPIRVDVRPGSMRDESAVYDEKEAAKNPSPVMTPVEGGGEVGAEGGSEAAAGAPAGESGVTPQ